MAENTGAQSLLTWFKNPASLISLSAAILSIATFMLLYVRKGEIEITLPQQLGIGVAADTRKYELLISATYSNSGAPARRYNVYNITANVISQGNTTLLDGEYKWIFEQRFIGADEWFKKYPGKADEGHRDYVDYVSRAVPFVIKGGDWMAKLIELEGKRATNSDFPRVLQLELRAHSESGLFTASARYVCPSEAVPVGKVSYCEREAPSN